MRWRPPQLVALAAVLLAPLAAGSGSVWAAAGGPPTTSPTSSSPSPTSLPATTVTTARPAAPSTVPGPTTTSTPPLLSGPATSTTTTRPGAPTSTTSTTSTTTTPPGGADATGLTGGVIPPEAQAEIAHYPVTPPGTTDPLLAALAPLQRLGLSADQIAAVGFGRFPIAGHAIWADGFLEPRFGADGSFKFHHAIDIPAACGTPERAPDEGTLTQGSDPGGGTTVEITEPDGTYIYMAHLSGYAAGTASGQHVHVGDLIGYVGQTGDATGCHLHLEIHPQGGEPVDPKPFVDAWYADALATAPVLVDAARADHGVLSPDALASVLAGVGRP